MGMGLRLHFSNNSDLFFGSTHQMPLYPGTGAKSEIGVGNIHNFPLPPGAAGTAFRHTMEKELLPALVIFQPDLILISAGFDAHIDDPLAQLCFETEDYAWVTEKLVATAAEHCQGRLVSSLEGGYDLEALAASVAVHVRALMAA